MAGPGTCPTAGLAKGLRKRRDDGFGGTIGWLLDQPLIPSTLLAD
ncbi:MAG: hypothetical protein WBR28_06670 [Mycobacterium sp.]